DRLQQELLAGLEADDADRQRLAAELLLSMRLNQFVRLSDTVEIDVTYVSCAEYQLFLDAPRVIKESFQEAFQHQPAHWRVYKFHRGSARMPIAGIRH